MELKFTKKNKTLIVKIDGEIDHHTCEVLRRETEKSLNKIGGKNIIFRLGEVSFMDSSGIGVMIGRYKFVESLGGRIAVAEASESVEKIFEFSAIHSLIPSFRSVEEALQYVEGGQA